MSEPDEKDDEKPINGELRDFTRLEVIELGPGVTAFQRPLVKRPIMQSKSVELTQAQRLANGLAVFAQRFPEIPVGFNQALGKIAVGGGIRAYSYGPSELNQADRMKLAYLRFMWADAFAVWVFSD